MKFEFNITRVSDGKRVEGDQKDWPHDVDNLAWYWTEGNYGCDCNRALLWNDITGENEPEDP